MIIALIIAILTICFLIFALFRSKAENIRLEAEKHRLEDRIEIINGEILEKEKRIISEEERFKLLATQILSDKSDEIRHNNEIRLNEILTPFRQDIERLGKTVNECYSSEARERYSLQQRIKDLVDIKQVLGREAKELSLALKGNNKIQGQWGEIVLENVLKSSGLRKNEEYFLQESSSDISPDDAFTRIRPDVIVRYPGSGSVIIDSKTSLNAFIEWVNADEENERHRWGLKHVESIKRHVDELARKAYQRLSKDSGADFVLMFIPNDAAYMAAMQIDGAIWQRAYDKNIIIVSPTLLIGALRIISRQWDYDRQNRNALRIAKTAGSMYDKFVGFVEDMERIENGINSLNRIYSESMKKLRDGSGSLISRAERLKEMGVESKKQLKITGESNNEDDI